MRGLGLLPKTTKNFLMKFASTREQSRVPVCFHERPLGRGPAESALVTRLLFPGLGMVCVFAARSCDKNNRMKGTTMKNRLTTLGILGKVLALELLLTQATSARQTPLPPSSPPTPPRSAAISSMTKMKIGNEADNSALSDNSSPSYYSPAIYGTNLWLQPVTNWTIDPWGIYYANLVLHNTTNATIYEILIKTNLSDPFYIPVTLGNGTAGTNQTVLSIALSGYNWEGINNWYYWNNAGLPPNPFFLWAWGGVSFVYLEPSEATTLVWPSSTTFTPFAYPAAPTPLVLTCQVFGSAVNGVDYSISGLNSSGTTTIPAGTLMAPPITISTLDNTNAAFGNVFITLILVPGNRYVTYPGLFSESVIFSNSIPVTVVTNLPSPWVSGIDYKPDQNALILSANDPSGLPNNFILLGTNSSGALTITNWSNVAGAPNEVEVATVKRTANGFVQGDTYFGNGAVIDKLSADGSQWTMNWCSLTNATETDSSGINGLRVDDSGAFGGDLIVTTMNGVWLIQSDANGNAHPMLLTNILAAQTLGNVITLTNDVAKWGPWAGKILTGDLYEEVLYAIDTNRVVTVYNTDFAGGIAIEDFALIPANQDLYFVDALDSKLMKISRTVLAPYVGDLVINQTINWNGGADGYGPAAELVIVAWDSVDSIFKAHIIPASGILEDETFAPLNLPSQ